MNFNLSRRDLILIIGFWLIGCSLLGVVFYFIIFDNIAPEQKKRPPRPQATFTLEHTQSTAKSLQQATQSQLGLWQQDAQLFSVAATWQKTELGQVGQPATWTYRFYSPGQKRLYFVSVHPDGQVTGTSHAEHIRTAPYPVPTEDWLVDSSEAINIWLNHGGAAMLAAIPGIQVVAQLQVTTPEAPLTWTVGGYDPITKNYHTLFINAKTKDIVNIKSSLTQ